MKRTLWKWLFGISLASLAALVLFTIGFWVLFNVGGAVFLAMMGNTQINAVPFAEFMSNFVGSPLFYIYLADLAVLLISAIGLIVTRKHM